MKGHKWKHHTLHQSILYRTTWDVVEHCTKDHHWLQGGARMVEGKQIITSLKQHTVCLFLLTSATIVISRTCYLFQIIECISRMYLAGCMKSSPFFDPPLVPSLTLLQNRTLPLCRHCMVNSLWAGWWTDGYLQRLSIISHHLVFGFYCQETSKTNLYNTNQLFYRV